MKYREFIRILSDNGFGHDRTKGSHHQYEGIFVGQRRIVTVDYDQDGDEIDKRNLASMIRQSGLSKKLFRK